MCGDRRKRPSVCIRIGLVLCMAWVGFTGVGCRTEIPGRSKAKAFNPGKGPVNSIRLWTLPMLFNLDGEVNVLDVVSTINIVLSEEYDISADLNQDNVINVQDNVSLIEIFVNSKIFISEYFLKFSLTLSNITTVSFIE